MYVSIQIIRVLNVDVMFLFQTEANDNDKE